MYSKNKFVDGDVLYAEQLNHVEVGILTVEDVSNQAYKNCMLISEPNPTKPKNFFDYHPLLERTEQGHACEYDPVENAVYGTALAFGQRFMTIPYPIIFEKNQYYKFSGKYKHNLSNNLIGKTALSFVLEYADGYQKTMYLYGTQASKNGYVNFEFGSYLSGVSMLERGGLKNMYFSYGSETFTDDSGNPYIVWLKDMQIEFGVTGTDSTYEKPEFIRTAVDYVARQKLERMFSFDAATSTLRIHMD